MTEEYLVNERHPKEKGREVYLGIMRTERHLRLQYAIARVLAESPSVHEALPKLLQTICILMGWEVGEYWRLGVGEKVLRSAGIWIAPKLEGIGIQETVQSRTFPRGSGLPGRVWANGKAICLSPLEDDKELPYASEMARFGMKSVFAIPIRLESEVMSVIMLFSQQAQKPDKDQVELLEALGHQIAVFIKRKDAEEALEKSEHRFRALIENSSDAIALLGSEGEILYLSPSVQHILGYSYEEFVGKNVCEFVHPDDCEHTKSFLARLLHMPGSNLATMYRIRHKNGSWRWMESIGTNVF